MPNIQQQIVDKAREYVGTPFHHQGRLKGVGVDCVGLIICVSKELGLGLEKYDNTNYSRSPSSTALFDVIAKTNLVELPSLDIQLGDILVFFLNPRTRAPQHIAFFSDIGMIHTYEKAKKVSEHSFTKKWRESLLTVFRFPQAMEGTEE